MGSCLGRFKDAYSVYYDVLDFLSVYFNFLVVFLDVGLALINYIFVLLVFNLFSVVPFIELVGKLLKIGSYVNFIST